MRWALVAALLVLCGPQGAHAQSAAVRIVFFTAEWCPNCQVLGPEIARAVGRVPGVERIDIDTTNAERLRDSRLRAQASGVSRLYDAYAGKTGFAAIVNVGADKPVTCITSTYRAPEIEAMLRRAVSFARMGRTTAQPRARGTRCPPEMTLAS